MVTVALSSCLNVVVLTLLHQLAPTQTEVPSLALQLGALAVIAAVAIRALRRRRVMA